MAFGARHLSALVALATVGLLLVLAASPVPVASANACSRWGDEKPNEITKGQARDAVLCLVNRERSSRGLSSIARNKKLQKAAQGHTKRMHGTGCFAHECPGEADLTGRLEGAGYLTGGLSRWIYAENVAWGLEHRGTPAAIVQAWMDSPPHRDSMLHPLFKELGVGFESGTPSSKNAPGGVYTLDLGLAVSL